MKKNMLCISRKLRLETIDHKGGKRMSNMLRKYRRAQKEKIHYCCGQKMSRKSGYDTDTHDFYFCEVCGKEKYVAKGDRA